MKNILVAALLLTVTPPTLAEEQSLDLKTFAQTYFDAMVATQAPGATSKELENYLALLTDDIGHSHLPYVTDDSRQADGKQAMRKGMTYYLGAHTEYSAELLDVFTFNTSAVAIRYKHSAKGIHPQNQQAMFYSKIMMEALELENGKVAVIRKYHE